MTRAELVERMARALCERNCTECGQRDRHTFMCGDGWHVCIPDATAALRAIEAAGAVVVPKEATGEMVDAVHDAIDAARYVNIANVTPSEVRRVTPRMVLAAMLATSPYAEKPQK